MGRSLWETRCVPMALGQPTCRMANQLLDPGRLLGPAVRGGARSEAAAAPCCTKGRDRQRWRPFRKSGTGQGGQGSEASACLLAIHPTGPPRQHLVAGRRGGERPGLARTRGVACLRGGGRNLPRKLLSSFELGSPGNAGNPNASRRVAQATRPRGTATPSTGTQTTARPADRAASASNHGHGSQCRCKMRPAPRENKGSRKPKVPDVVRPPLLHKS